MVTLEEVKRLIGDVLQLGKRAQQLDSSTALLGSIPEFDSMAVVALITAIEERFGVVVDDDEISAKTFETVGSVHTFISHKVAA